MFKNPRILLLIIVVITLLATVVVWPSVPLKFSIGPAKVDTVIRGPKLDFEIFGLRIKRDLDAKLGLDLQGGTSLTLKADVQKIPDSEKDKALEAVKEVIERRINFLGVSEPIVQTSKVGDEHRIIIELPGVTNVEEARELVGQTAKLEFREFTDPATPPGTIPTLENTKPTEVSGTDLKSANADIQPAAQGGPSTPVVRFVLKSDSANKFRELTRRLVNKPLIVFLDERPISAPIVQTEIGEEGVITGVTTDEAKRIAIQLSAGALPVEKIDIISERNIGPTLGRASINRSLVAGVIGISAVAIFMVLYYGFLGLIADIALLIYAILVLAIFKSVPVTLTLAGIAGFILSIGMAVDANILIFERYKEEIRSGRAKGAALQIGFSRAWSSIRDSNMSSLITSGILFWFGTGAVRGFALALAIGILVSMFTAIIVTRNFLRVFLRA